MNKDKLSSWTLVASAILIIGSMVAINDPEFSPNIWSAIGAFILGLAFAFITWRLRVAVRKENEAAAEAVRRQQAEQAENAKRAREEQEERRKKERERFKVERFAVAGVTFKNNDGTDRQKILREILLNEDGFTNYEFSENEEDENPAIQVMTDIGCVGFIRKSDKEKVRKFYDRKVYSSWLSVELFESLEGEKIYRADVYMRMDREDPEEQWYFDELQKS